MAVQQQHQKQTSPDQQPDQQSDLPDQPDQPDLQKAPAAPVVGAFYFGVWRPEMLGHFLRDPEGNRYGDYTVPDDFPVRVGFHEVLDGGLLGPDRGEQREGRGVMVYISGWTVLSFWDRSADRRHGAVSSFVLRGALDLPGALAAARAAFPHVWERHSFEVEIFS